jgi:genome maintenance exonuclease 1
MKFNFCPPVEIPDIDSVTLPDGKRFYSTPDGKKLPSVTTVMSVRSKQAIMEWRDRVGHQEANKISRSASSRGTKLHKMCEDYTLGKPITETMPIPKALFASVKPLIDKHLTDIWYQEQALYSLQLNMAGRCDLIAHWDGKLSIIDYKSSAKPKKKDYILHYMAQECAYALMLEERIGVPVDQLVTVIGVEGGEPQVFIEKTEDHINYLVESIQIYNEANK